MENMDEMQRKLQEEFSRLNKRLDSIEGMLHNQTRHSWGNSVWVLVPVAAIIMWGLTTIFG